MEGRNEIYISTGV